MSKNICIIALLLCFAASTATVDAQERFRVLAADGREYIIVPLARARPISCMDIDDPADCQASDQCALVAFGVKSLCVKKEKVDELYNVLAAGWNTSPYAASCASIGNESICQRSKKCDVYESPDDLLCAPITFGDGQFTTQAVDDFEILLGRNDASADVEAGLEVLAKFGEDVTNTKIAGFAGWDIDADASLYQFARGTVQAGQTNSVGIGAAVSRDEIEIGPEIKREVGSDIALLVPAIRYRTKN